MNILIIGGTRFVGLAVAKQLADRGHRVTLFHRTMRDDLPFAQFQGDLNDVASLHTCLVTVLPDCIIHMYAMNGGQIEMLRDALAQYPGTPRVVVISSADVYRAFEVVNQLTDAPVQPTPFTENSALRRVPPYPGAEGKYEKQAVEQAAFPLDAICVRLGMVYGENDYQRRFTDIFAAMHHTNEITLPHNIAHWRSCYIGVNNAAYGIALLAEQGELGEIYNLSGDDILTELEWHEKIAKLLHWQGTITLSANNTEDGNFAQDLILDTTKIKAATGYSDLYTSEQELMKCPRE
jgi:nucleoside-diphosphate-sugar epimerase